MSDQTTNGELKIETGVPIPERKYGWPSKGTTGLFQKMNVGDSILISPAPKSGSMYSTARYAGIRITQRKVEGGMRVWRIA